MPLGSSSAAPVTRPGPSSSIDSVMVWRRSCGLAAAALLAMRMVDPEALRQAVGGKLTRGIVRQAERVGDRRAEQGIAERVQDESERAFGDMMVLVADGQLGDEGAD